MLCCMDMSHWHGDFDLTWNWNSHTSKDTEEQTHDTVISPTTALIKRHFSHTMIQLLIFHLSCHKTIMHKTKLLCYILVSAKVYVTQISLLLSVYVFKWRHRPECCISSIYIPLRHNKLQLVIQHILFKYKKEKHVLNKRHMSCQISQ